LKLQASYLSYILLAGVVISLATAAILWGQPLLTKNKIKSEVDSLEKFVIDFANSLDKLRYENKIDFDVNYNAYISISNNIITVTYNVPQNVIYSPNLKDIPLNILIYSPIAISEPTCVVNLSTTNTQIIYEIFCRIHKDPITGRCYTFEFEELPTLPLKGKLIIEKVDERKGSYPNCTLFTIYKLRISVS